MTLAPNQHAARARAPSRATSFGVLHVAPLVAEFLPTYQEVAIELHLSDVVIDLIGDGFDAAKPHRRAAGLFA